MPHVENQSPYEKANIALPDSLNPFSKNTEPGLHRRPFCKACSNEKHGVKTRIRVIHTCGKDDNPK